MPTPKRGPQYWVSVPSGMRHFFPGNIYESDSRWIRRPNAAKGLKGIPNKAFYRPFGKEFGTHGNSFNVAGKGGVRSNPFSTLNIKINGAQKSYTTNSQKVKGKVKGLTFAWLKQDLKRIIEKIEVNSQNFVVVLTLRAQKIFQDSFKYRKFYSADGKAWPQLQDSTIRRRVKRGTWPGAGGMLREYGDMYESIQRKEYKASGLFGRTVFTDSSYYKSHNDKRGRFCYAGIHNEPAIGRGAVKKRNGMPQRQFIGHSTYLLDFAIKQADRYFFYDIFD